MSENSYDDGSRNENTEGTTFREIVLKHLKRISDLASVEFRGGYWDVKKTPVEMGGAGTTLISKTYVPDTREAYSNAIENLADMLYPYFDEQMTEDEKNTNAELDKAYKSNTVVVEETREDKNPEEEQEKRKFQEQDHKKSYRDERVRINRKLFRSLCAFLYRKQYLEIGNMED